MFDVWYGQEPPVRIALLDGAELALLAEDRSDLHVYRTMSPSFVMFGVLLERQAGPVTVFLNGENLTDRRLTRFQPLLLPTQAPDGRWTTDAWGPLDGRVISLRVRWRFAESAAEHSSEAHDEDEPAGHDPSNSP